MSLIHKKVLSLRSRVRDFLYFSARISDNRPPRQYCAFSSSTAVSTLVRAPSSAWEWLPPHVQLAVGTLWQMRQWLRRSGQSRDLGAGGGAADSHLGWLHAIGPRVTNGAATPLSASRRAHGPAVANLIPARFNNPFASVRRTRHAHPI
ncbi:hypothetical protein Purlil1_8542 [Purpureocillium lilacinum]|uniref:Uncharacterized protein n=1 Tax=Purpureocillium lilacinum TaxID=33203 RepID=A0ABR0BTK3_PURLI|nr:hypothetical protein Purlil1_8542 [Purpureocillium lilacinum]